MRRRLGSFYTSFAIVALNVVLFAVTINAVIALGMSIDARLHPSNALIDRQGFERLTKVYPGWNRADLEELLNESWSRPVTYETFTQFKERPFVGRYVNVTEQGFRKSAAQAPWPPDPRSLNIFVFGGSTAFGYGQPDSATIPSHLQESLQARVYNFARGWYYSTQERLLFEKLLTNGYVPKIALFIDGLNDTSYRDDQAEYTARFERFVASGGAASARNGLNAIIARLPVMQLMNRIAPDECVDCPTPAPLGEETTIEARKMLGRYLSNKKMIEADAAAYGITPVFVWQPVPTYRYDLAAHLFPEHVYDHQNLSGIGYALLEKSAPQGNFVRCDGIQAGRHEPLYVDSVHYTAAFSAEIGACIADQIVARGLRPAN